MNRHHCSDDGPMIRLSHLGALDGEAMTLPSGRVLAGGLASALAGLSARECVRELAAAVRLLGDATTTLATCMDAGEGRRERARAMDAVERREELAMAWRHVVGARVEASRD